MTVPKTGAKFADDVLEDPIKLIQPEETRVHFENCDLSGAEIIDYGYKVEIQESDFQGSTVQLPVHEQPSEALQPHKSNIVNRSLKVKLVDCKTFPWYYKKYKRQLYNIAATIDLSATNENIQEAINLDEDNLPNDGELLKTFTYINSSKVPKEIKELNHTNLEYCLDLVKQNALRQKGCKKIDFKRNKGLVGLTIKRNIRLEKFKKGNVLAENTSNIIDSKISSNENNSNVDDVVCEYIIDHDTTAINNNIENKKTSIKSKSSLSPGSYKLSHLITGEKVITLVRSLQHTFDPNKSVLSPMNISTGTESEKLSKITKNCIKRSNKKIVPKSKLIKKKYANTKEKPDKRQIPKKTIEKHFIKPMPKCRKLQLQKQRKENELIPKKNIIENKVITSQAILIGSRVSVPSQKSSDTKSSVERKTLNNNPTLKQLLETDASLKDGDNCVSDSLNTASLQNGKPLNNNICLRQTSTKSPKMCSDSKNQFINSCVTALAKSCPESSKKLDSDRQTNLTLAPTTINNKSANVACQKYQDKTCLNSKNISVVDNCKNVKSSNTVLLKSVDKLGPKPLSSPCANTPSYSYSQPSNKLLTDSNNLQLADESSKKPSEKLESNTSNKLSGANSVKPSPVSTYDSRLGTSNNLQLESSKNLHSNFPTSLNPNADIPPKSTDNVYTQSYTISMCTDKLIYTVSNFSNIPSSHSAPNDLKHKTVTSSNTTKNVETENVCNIEHEIKNEPLDLVVDIENNTLKDELQNNQSNVPQNNRSNTVARNKESNAVAQNNKTDSVPQTNRHNTAQDSKNNYTNNFKNVLPKPFPSHEITPTVVDRPPYSVSASARKPYIVRIRNPISMDRTLQFDNVANRLNQYQGQQQNSWNAKFDNQKPIYQEPHRPNMFRQPLSPLTPRLQNNSNNFYFSDHCNMPVNPRMPKFIPRGMNMDWPQPNYYCNNSGLWNYDSNYAIQPNNPIAGTHQDGFVRKINIYPNYPPVPIRNDVHKKAVGNSSGGKNIVSVSMKQNAAIGPRPNDPVKTRSEMLQELDSVIASNSPLDNSTPANNLQKPSNIPVQISGPIPISPCVKRDTFAQKSNNSSDLQKSQDYSPPILPIPSYENILSKTLLGKKAENCVKIQKESKPKEVSKPRNPNKRTLSEELNKQKISLDEYKRRGCS